MALSRNAKERLDLWVGGESLTLEATCYPKRCELRFTSQGLLNVLVLHNFEDTNILGELLYRTSLIQIFDDDSRRMDGQEGGRFRICLCEDYDAEFQSTLIDAYEYYSTDLSASSAPSVALW